MLIDSIIANEFLAVYKGVLTEVNGGQRPQNIDEYIKCRDLLYSDSVSIADCTSVTDDFRESLSKAMSSRPPSRDPERYPPNAGVSMT